MKKILSILLLVVFLLGAFTPMKEVKAAALPAYESAIQVQNLDAVEVATISIAYYNPDGSLSTLPAPYTNPVTDTVQPSSSNTYLPIHPNVGFKGSVVVSSDKQIAIISNLTIAATNRALGTYTGVASGGASLFFPLIDKRNNVSVFSIQNASSEVANYVIDFVPMPGGSYADIPNLPGTLQPGAAATYNMADYNGTNPWLGSIKVTASTGALAGVVSNVNTNVPSSPTNGVYNGFSAGSSTAILPLIMENNNGNRTGASCQNLGPGPATITMSYTPATGYPARDADVFVDVPENGIAVKVMDYVGTTKWVGGSTVTVSGSANIACVVNQTRPAKKNSNLYEGFNPAAATDTVVMPLIMSKNGTTTKAFTAFSVASTDGSNINVTCDWKPSTGFGDIADTTKGGAAVLVFSQQTGFSAGDTRWIGSAVCTETGGKSIVAVVNQSREGLPADYVRDVTSAYDAFNQ
ncbi:MAG: hypothetical protein WCY93_10450 [Anaerolineaceae bacterium]